MKLLRTIQYGGPLMLVCLLGLGVTLCLFVLELAESYLTFTAEQLRREWKREDELRP